ncbi:MAG: cupin domain-containing protein, partial [Rhizobacter sp.]|nr:cupin domain-containing protein [Chlorobiales bacterium]
MLYHTLGTIPHKRHTQFRKADGSLYREELVSTKGFAGIYSTVYHLDLPTKVHQIGETKQLAFPVWNNDQLRHHHLRLNAAPRAADYLSSRTPVLFNSDVLISTARPTDSMNYFYRNAAADELIFVHEGSGILETLFGTLAFKQGDYVLIPRGTTHQFRFSSSENRL